MALKFEGMLSEERLHAIRSAPRPLAGDMVGELLSHIAALEERHAVTNQYYEEFLIPEIEKNGWSDRVQRRRSSRGRDQS